MLELQAAWRLVNALTEAAHARASLSIEAPMDDYFHCRSAETRAEKNLVSALTGVPANQTGYLDDAQIRTIARAAVRELDPSTLPFVPADASTDDNDDTADFVAAAFGVPVIDPPPYRIPDMARDALNDLKTREKVG